MYLFGTDGIRDKVFEGVVNPVEFVKLGIVYGDIVTKFSTVPVKIGVAVDGRSSSKFLLFSFVSGLLSSNASVVDFDKASSGVFSFNIKNQGLDGGIYISASHNSFEYDGIKFFDKNGSKISIDMQYEIEESYRNFDSDYFQNKLKKLDKDRLYSFGQFSKYPLHVLDYQNYLMVNVFREQVKNPIKIVVDQANGATFLFSTGLLKLLGVDVVSINDKPNGRNINENSGVVDTTSCRKSVIDNSADLGICFDGDGDRLVVIDEKGDVVSGDHLIGFFAQCLNKKDELKNNAIVCNLLSNLGLEEFLETMKIKLHRTYVGDRFISYKLDEEMLSFGAEESGHIIFKKYSNSGDGVLSAILLIKFLDELKEEGANSKVSELLRPFKLYPCCKADVECDVQFDSSEEFVTVLDKKIKENHGSRIIVRNSGTEKIIRVMVESEDELTAKKLCEEIKSDINTYLLP